MKKKKNKKSTICLTMIVKNEASCIAKCLNHMKDYIDYWVICDTGSVDNTVNIIKETMAGIPGEVLHHQWQDFATNRNLGIEAAKEKADYTLIMDADDSLIVEDKNIFNNLNKDAYRLKIKHGTLEYYRPQLIKNTIDFKYKGVLHEYIELPQCEYVQLDGCYIQTSFNGARSRNPNKFKDDAEVLEKALIVEPNNDRYRFYLAQSYRDAGMDLKAIENYEKRAMMGGWREEIFISLLEAAKAKERLGFNIYDIECAYLKASYTHPGRAEPLYYLSKLFRCTNNMIKAYCYAKLSLQIPKPEEALFLEEDCYYYKRLDELGICSYYIGHIDEGRYACEELLKLNIPIEEKQRIENNLRFYLKK